MWMCNTATTSMLLPVLESVLRQIEDTDNIQGSGRSFGVCWWNVFFIVDQIKFIYTPNISKMTQSVGVYNNNY